MTKHGKFQKQWKQDRINLELNISYEQWLEGKLYTAQENVISYIDETTRLNKQMSRCAIYIEKVQQRLPFLLKPDIEVAKMLGVLPIEKKEA